MEEQASNSSWLWLQQGALECETESYNSCSGAPTREEPGLRKMEHRQNVGYAKVMLKQSGTLFLRARSLQKKEYKRRHDKLAQAVHWGLRKRQQLPRNQEWYKHQPEGVFENNKVEILWDSNIYVDRFLKAKRPDTVVVDKEEEECVIIDIAVPAKQNIEVKEAEKIGKYQELAREITKMWDVKTITVLIVVSALGAISI